MSRSPRAGLWAALLTVAALAVTACAPEASVEIELPTQVEGALAEDVQGQLRAAVETAMATTGSTGAIAQVRAPWAGTWTEAFGTTTPGGAPVEVGMPFKAGAITRTMTCDVLYGLADRGVVGLDDPLTDWLTGYPSAADVTLEQLCDGTSGLSSYSGQLLRRWLANPERVWLAKELASYGFARGFAFAPGTAYRDADTGYILLGLALERASGKTAAVLFDEYVFAPLGMTSSALPASTGGSGDWLNGLRSPNDAEGGVDCAAPQDLTALSPTAGFTAAGAVSTVDDLSHYAQALAAGARSYDTEGRFAEPLPVSAKAPSWYTAAGGAFQAGSMVGQAGSVPGYLTAVYADRETGMSVVVVLNNSRASGSIGQALAWQLAAITSLAPAAAGATAPQAGLPWEADTYGQQIVDAAICPLP